MAKNCNSEREIIDTRSLKELAIYLSGIRDGKGNLLPLGTIVLENLWKTIAYLHGDVKYYAERDINKVTGQIK